MSDITYRWCDGPQMSDADWDRENARLEPVLITRGWASLSKWTSRILIAETSAGDLVGFIVLQALPFVGPLYTVPSARGTGIAEDLSDQMQAFLTENKARGWVAIAESPHAAKLCEQRGMKRVENVYATDPPGTVEV